jgi:hypothetical protein
VTAVVIAKRIYSGDYYRSRYYRECVDGLPRLGDKADAARFEPALAESVVRQLNAIARDGFFAADPYERLKRDATPQAAE